MNEDTRNAIERATQRARKLLEGDFDSQLEGTFDVTRDGAVAQKAGSHLSARQIFQRDKIVAAIEHKLAAEMSPTEAVVDYLRDAAFTTLNRFVALKMLEARELVQECITKGEQSTGYREFCGMAPGVALLPESAGYRIYIESLFDELSTEVKVLFDRRSPASILWPKRATFETLLEILNAAELASVWGEDETIGWVYQYFNSRDERKAMRKESRAPRNGRDLAIRNQFFTPRYVVQFLTDNTLGRTWYEMRAGGTALKTQCLHLINPRSLMSDAGRPKKDPRDLRVLDPSCGSGHFLLYVFDLLLTIYEESWHDANPISSETTGNSLRIDYPEISLLRLAIPSLILRCNLYGIDIDARCAQIAQLSIWMRAQRAYKDYSIVRNDRPRIVRTNIVVAEPMPGEPELRHEFISSLDRKLGTLVDIIFKLMELAGDAGSLLDVGNKLRGSIRELYGEAGILFRKRDEEQWLEAEADVLSALNTYAHAVQSHDDFRRRIFAEDAARGFAFIDVSMKEYDVVLMNPPFGEFSNRYKSTARKNFPSAYNDILAAFTLRWYRALAPRGLLGAITSRTCFFLTTFAPWRDELLHREQALELSADFGEGVMDDAAVEAAAYVLRRDRPSGSTLFFRLLGSNDLAAELEGTIADYKRQEPSSRIFELDVKSCRELPDGPIVYWVHSDELRALAGLPRLEPCAAKVRQGMVTGDNPRFVRALWEVPGGTLATHGDFHDATKAWAPLVMKGASQPWYSPLTVAVRWAGFGAEIKARWIHKGDHPSRNVRSEELYFQPGMSWTRRAVRFIPYAIPSGAIPTASRYMAFPSCGEAYNLLGVCASNVASSFLRFYGEWFSRPNFLVENLKALPWPEIGLGIRNELERIVRAEVAQRRSVYQKHEPYHDFIAPSLLLRDSGDSNVSKKLDGFLPQGVENAIAEVYGLHGAAYDHVTRDLREAVAWSAAGPSASSGDDDDDEDEAGEEFVLSNSSYSMREGLVSYAVGVLFGRWDVRLALDPRLTLTQSDPFGPLSPSPAGALVRADGLPADSGSVVDVDWLDARSRGEACSSSSRIPDSEYPIRVAWDGVLVDDKGHQEDISDRVRSIFDLLFSSPETELTETIVTLAGPRGTLRGWLRSNFFRDHLARYSKSRRKAPLYWQLSTRNTRYSVWLYCHRTTNDTLYKVTNDFVVPKLRHEERKLADLVRETGDNPSSGQRTEILELSAFVEELREFRDEISTLAALWKPTLADGVSISCAPLWRLTSTHKGWQKELRTTWDDLKAGEYDWAHLAMHLWPERVVPTCVKDRSLAIAHGLEDLLWVTDFDRTWQPRRPRSAVLAHLSSSLHDAFLTSSFQEIRTFWNAHYADTKDEKPNWWHRLEEGQYDTEPLAYALWPERIVKKAATDRAVAEAHKLLDLYDAQQRTPGSNPEKGLKTDRKRKVVHSPRHTAAELAILRTFCSAPGDAVDWASRWAAFDAGEFDATSELALRVRTERVVKLGTDNVSVAEHHRFERWFWLRNGAEVRRLDEPEEEVRRAIEARTSEAVKAALKSLLEAPMAPTSKTSARPRGGR